LKNILVTGTAGFIGYHLTKRLVDEGYYVIAVDNINEYYDTKLKYDRLAQLGILESAISSGDRNNGSLHIVQSEIFENLKFYKLDLSAQDQVETLFTQHKFNTIFHLAAQAGVRYSLEHPKEYIKSNIEGTFCLLEAAKRQKPDHFIFASSSSVYGMSDHFPLSEKDDTSRPVSMYAATKKTTELMAYTYAHLYDIKTTGLRFFTVYGPWARPDMALTLFADAIVHQKPIQVFNHGNMLRDYTYVVDVVEGIMSLFSKENSSQKDQSDIYETTPFQVFNIGNAEPVKLMNIIELLEKALKKSAIMQFQELQAGDVIHTHADTKKLYSYTGFRSKTKFENGVNKFVTWYTNYYLGNNNKE
jgi:UDP-glucuronate 4-epimerase